MPTNRIVRGRRTAAGRFLVNAGESTSSTVTRQKPNRKNTSALKQLHFEHVARVAKNLREDGEKIKMTQDATRFVDGGKSGYQTVLFHGLTVTPTKKTFIRSWMGNMQSWTESLA